MDCRSRRAAHVISRLSYWEALRPKYHCLERQYKASRTSNEVMVRSTLGIEDFEEVYESIDSMESPIHSRYVGDPR